MEMPPHLHLKWASKPGCLKPVAEVWIGDSDLWFIIFVDADDALKVEVFPSLQERIHILDFKELEGIIDFAKSELLNWRPPPVT
jgi:hypothetical protein